MLLAPLGAFAVNLAAITAALCTGPDAHPDPARRWRAGVFAGLLYIVVGLLYIALSFVVRGAFWAFGMLVFTRRRKLGTAL